MQRHCWLPGLMAAAAFALGLPRLGAEPASARIKLDPDRVIGEVHPLVFGNFVEHLGRCVYGGVFEEGSPLSDADGFRRDVMDAARGLGVTLLRWPGGNFASGYNWKDGIGPRDQRPARRDHAWGALETNRFGTDEFLRYCERLKVEPYLCINAGLGSVEEARQLGRIHERVRQHVLGAAAAQERPRPAVGREGLGPGQRDRRALAARPQERRGLRQVRPRGGQGHAPRRRTRSG